MHPHLERLSRAIASATGSMSPEDLRRHPEGKWCAAEVLEHLYLTYAGTVKGFEKCLQAGRPLTTPPSWKKRAAVFLVTGLGYFPRGRKAPEGTRPKGMPAEGVLSAIGPKIEVMDRLIAEAESRHGRRTPVLDHPILGPLTAQQWRKFHWVHGWHHLKQIWRLKQSYPRGFSPTTLAS